jgi:hypothetical protein
VDHVPQDLQIPTPRVARSRAGRWWTRHRDQKRPHALAPTDVVGVTTTGDHAQELRERWLSPRGRTLTGPTGPRLRGGVGG